MDNQKKDLIFTIISVFFILLIVVAIIAVLYYSPFFNKNQ